MTINVLIADDHTLFRQGLTILLSETPDLRVAALAADGAEALRLAAALGPQVALLDFAMPGMGGVEAARHLGERAPAVRVMGLSMFAEAGRVEAMLAAGAGGYALKEDSFEELVEGIRAVAGGGRWLSPRLGRAEAAGGLSPRELAVVRMLAEGGGYKDIAGRLGVTVKTVETYRQRAAQKLGAGSIAELVGRAAGAGLLEA